MDNSDNNSNSKDKSAASQPNLNLPALTKEFSNKLSELDKFSNNSHKQFQDLLSINDKYSKSLSRLNSIISTFDKSLQDISSIQLDFSSLKDSISSDTSHLQQVSDDLKDKIISLSNLHSDLNLFISNQNTTFTLSQKDFSLLLDTVLKSSESLDKLASALKPLIEQDHDLYTAKFSAIELKLTSHDSNFLTISNHFNSAKELALHNLRLINFDFLTVLLTLVLVFIYIFYLDFHYTKKFTQINDSLLSIDQHFQSLKPSPSPSPSLTPSISPKSDKKR